MQGNFCAFCERATVKNSGHIEHFFHKGQKPDGSAPYRHLTFSWDNLFGCCGKFESNTCGHFKDRQGMQGPGAYNANDIIKPDVDDPCSFFNFLTTGVIEAKEGLSANDTHKAKETIRVLNLAALNSARKRQIDIFKNELKTLVEISVGLDERQLSEELNKIKHKVIQQEYQTSVLEALF
ncbi:TIGR02646 family protein [Thalassotalea sp. SU-HH00458]